MTSLRNSREWLPRRVRQSLFVPAAVLLAGCASGGFGDFLGEIGGLAGEVVRELAADTTRKDLGDAASAVARRGGGNRGAEGGREPIRTLVSTAATGDDQEALNKAGRQFCSEVTSVGNFAPLSQSQYESLEEYWVRVTGVRRGAIGHVNRVNNNWSGLRRYALRSRPVRYNPETETLTITLPFRADCASLVSQAQGLRLERGPTWTIQVGREEARARDVMRADLQVLLWGEFNAQTHEPERRNNGSVLGPVTFLITRWELVAGQLRISGG